MIIKILKKLFPKTIEKIKQEEADYMCYLMVDGDFLTFNKDGMQNVFGLVRRFNVNEVEKNIEKEY